MSHHIRARVKITEKSYLLEAVKNLGWTFVETSSGIIQLGEQKALSLTQQRDGTWQVSGDPWYDEGKLHKYYSKTNELIADLQTHYNQIMVKDKLSQMGFYLENTEETKDEMVLTFENGV